MKKREKDVFDQMEPGLRTAFGFDVGPDEKAVPDELPDTVADLAFESQWGFPRPKADGGNPAPEQKVLSRAEIAKSLEALSRTLGKPGFKNTGELIAKLAEAAKEHLEADNPIRDWLVSYAKGDLKGARGAIKKLLAASRNEIHEYVKRAKDPQMQTGAPGSTVKKGNWTYKYDSAGSLQACYEGDDEPFIFAN
jgi:hypothetical protein